MGFDLLGLLFGIVPVTHLIEPGTKPRVVYALVVDDVLRHQADPHMQTLPPMNGVGQDVELGEHPVEEYRHPTQVTFDLRECKFPRTG